MELDAFIEKGGQKLRLGYTTGSCAAAAAKAAAFMLLTGISVPQVRLRTPKGMELYLEIEDIRITPEAVSCAVRKDSGDDPDITNHALIYAEVRCCEAPGVRIRGGEGVGRVTKPGLDQPVGSEAINSTPRKMIAEAVREAVREAEAARAEGQLPLGMAGTVSKPPSDMAETDGQSPSGAAGTADDSTGPKKGFEVTISVPGGQELARKTFNPKLGIVGGISILGTSGIVEPMSDRALLETIRVEINVRKMEGLTVLPAAPGSYGRNFFLAKYGFSLDTAVTTSNFICDTVKMAEEAGFTKMLFVGHIGKLVKVAGGIPNTHSQYGDHRMEILTKIAEEVSGKPFGRLKDCVATDEAVWILKEEKIAEAVLSEMARSIQFYMQKWAGGAMQVEVVVFSNVYGELAATECASEFIRILRQELTDAAKGGY